MEGMYTLSTALLTPRGYRYYGRLNTSASRESACREFLLYRKSILFALVHSRHSCSKAMPVAVVPTQAAAASKPKRAAHIQRHETPPPDTPKSTKKSRTKQAIQTQDDPVPGSSKSTQSSSWSWRSLTVSASSRVPLLFTQDRRCV